MNSFINSICFQLVADLRVQIIWVIVYKFFVLVLFLFHFKKLKNYSITPNNKKNKMYIYTYYLIKLYNIKVSINTHLQKLKESKNK